MNVRGVTEMFGVAVPDRCMVDGDRARIFAQIGRSRSLFARSTAWRWLDEALAEASSSLRATEGTAKWEQETGGVFQNGRPYCQMRSNLARRVVTDLANSDGGLLWRDDGGEEWAVRLFPASSPGEWLGISVNFPRSCSALPHSGIARAGGLRLGSRAEQLLWLLHGQILQQRSSEIRIADHTVAQVIWGADKDTWPKDWRREIKETIRSLRGLYFELLRIPSCGWEPRLGSFTSAVVGFSDLAEMARINGTDNFCDSSCQNLTNIPHDHFLIHVGPGFLGAMEGFAIETDSHGVRRYDFCERGQSAGEELQRYRADGGTPSVHLPTRIFGPAKWARISGQIRDVLNGLHAEVTRAPRSHRRDGAQIIRKRLVPSPSPHEKIECPLLDYDQQYVCFGGNGDRPGQGYRIIGEYGTGWLHKCGFELDDEFTNAAKSVRKFLRGLEQLGKLFGFRATAIDRQSGSWHDLLMMQETATRKFGWELLDRLLLRIYAPADYLDRLRAYFAEAGRFDELAGAPEYSSSASELDLASRLKRVGLRQAEIARRVGRSQPFLSNVLNGRKPWPEGLKEQVERIVADLETTA